jgi:signal transduction histidine kinase
MPLHEVVAQVVMLLRVEAERARVALEVEQQAQLDVAIDPLQIEQVLLNVLLNAVQATPAGKRIVIREQRDERDAIVDIVDEGPGIAAEHLPRIFSPFFTTKEKGTGLGLAIAHHIVVAHRGSLEVHETSLHGTNFRIRLPIAETPGAAWPPPRAEVAI